MNVFWQNFGGSVDVLLGYWSFLCVLTLVSKLCLVLVWICCLFRARRLGELGIVKGSTGRCDEVGGFRYGLDFIGQVKPVVVEGNRVFGPIGDVDDWPPAAVARWVLSPRSTEEKGRRRRHGPRCTGAPTALTDPFSIAPAALRVS